MTKWLYYNPRYPQDPGQSLKPTGEGIEKLGPTQLAIMQRARQGRSGLVLLAEGDERERLAAKRLVDRRLLRKCVERPKPVGQPFNIPGSIQLRTYVLTERGRHCWLRVAK